jgi:hypothetical protein
MAITAASLAEKGGAWSLEQDVQLLSLLKGMSANLVAKTQALDHQVIRLHTPLNTRRRP